MGEVGVYEEGLAGGRVVMGRSLREEEEIHEGGLVGGERGVLDSLPRSTNMAVGQTTYVSADKRNFSEFYLSG